MPNSSPPLGGEGSWRRGGNVAPEEGGWRRRPRRAADNAAHCTPTQACATAADKIGVELCVSTLLLCKPGQGVQVEPRCRPFGWAYAVGRYVEERAPREWNSGACRVAAAGDDWEARLIGLCAHLAKVLPDGADFEIVPWFVSEGRVMFVLTARVAADAPADAGIEELVVPSPMADAAIGATAAPAADAPADAPAAEVSLLSQTLQVLLPALPLDMHAAMSRSGLGPGYFDGPASARIAPGDALYLDWLLKLLRDFPGVAAGVSEYALQVGGDEGMRQAGKQSTHPRWTINQVMMFFHKQILDEIVKVNFFMVEGDVSLGRAFRGCRQGQYWWVGSIPEGALLYDFWADLLFCVKGIVQALDFKFAEVNFAPLQHPFHFNLLPFDGSITYDGMFQPLTSAMDQPAVMATADRLRPRLAELCARPPIMTLLPEHALLDPYPMRSIQVSMFGRSVALPREGVVKVEQPGDPTKAPADVNRWWEGL
ncbi:hypothetical protein T492DRAFT_879222 [Pavlovales sp. CCMP2436]|nr:hypothetical protein T492DRAFT_879222 [Pavlovales sp. CCMP2436]